MKAFFKNSPIDLVRFDIKVVNAYFLPYDSYVSKPEISFGVPRFEPGMPDLRWLTSLSDI